jgi:hypothetical protein
MYLVQTTTFSTKVRVKLSFSNIFSAFCANNLNSLNLSKLSDVFVKILHITLLLKQQKIWILYLPEEDKDN